MASFSLYRTTSIKSDAKLNQGSVATLAKIITEIAKEKSDDPTEDLRIAVSLDSNLSISSVSIDDFFENTSSCDKFKSVTVQYKTNGTNESAITLFASAYVNQVSVDISIHSKLRVFVEGIAPMILQKIEQDFFPQVLDRQSNSSEAVQKIEWSNSERERQDDLQHEDHNFRNQWNIKSYMIAIIAVIVSVAALAINIIK